MLGSAMQTLRTRTAGRQAGPSVERALLRMFRQVPFEATQSVAAHRFTPIALGLSRFFEVGAYVAVAAAIVIGLFLGVRLLEQRAKTTPVQSYSAPVTTAPTQVNTASTQDRTGKAIAATTHEHSRSSRKLAVGARSTSNSAKRLNTASASQTSDDPEYVALMFCDPLSCSSDTQVVRMELPAAGATSERDAQPQIADVVVGYDGVVRAVRIVN